MPQPASNFDALEKQLAKDALDKALKDLHGEITREIELVEEPVARTPPI